MPGSMEHRTSLQRLHHYNRGLGQAGLSSLSLMAFAAGFPYLIYWIVLLALEGITRRLSDEYEAIYFRYLSLLPSPYLGYLVGRTNGLKVSYSITGCADLPGQDQMGSKIIQETKVVRKEFLDMPAIVQWRFDNHQGFIHSITGTRQHRPRKYQLSDWRRVCNVIKSATAQTSPSS